MKKIFYLDIDELKKQQPQVCDIRGSISDIDRFQDPNLYLGSISINSLPQICQAFKDDIIVILFPFHQETLDIFLNQYWEPLFFQILKNVVSRYKNAFVYTGNDWDDVCYEYKGQSVPALIIKLFDRTNVSLSRLIWSMNNPYMKSKLYDIANIKAIPHKPFVYFNNYYLSRFKNLSPEYRVQLENHINKNKHFLMANRRPSDHRLALSAYLYTRHREKIHLSFNNASPSPLCPDTHAIEPANIIYDRCNYNFNNFKNIITMGNLQEFIDRWPLRLDYKGNGNFPVELQDSLATEFIYDSACHIVGETYYIPKFSHNEDGTHVYHDFNGFFTEKSLKPFLWGLPSIWLSIPYNLQSVKDVGFKTFDGLIDERYDELEDSNERFAAILVEIEKIANIQDINGWYKEGKSVYEYNFNLLQKYIHRNNHDVIREYCERVFDLPDLNFYQ